MDLLRNKIAGKALEISNPKEGVCPRDMPLGGIVTEETPAEYTYRLSRVMEVRLERYAGSKAVPHLGAVMCWYNACIESFSVSFIDSITCMCLWLGLNIYSTRIVIVDIVHV